VGNLRELFIYYRLTAGAPTAAVAAAVATFQTTLRAAHPGLRTRVLRRPVTPQQDGQTWMETYAFDDGAGAAGATGVVATAGISAALQAEIEQLAVSALSTWLAGPRHVEVFEPCA
jgi:hypothetical protein